MVRGTTAVGMVGCAVALTALLTGCGERAAHQDQRGPAASGTSSTAAPSSRPTTAHPTAPGADGGDVADRAFTEAELQAALLPAGAFGTQARVTETHVGGFDEWGQPGYDWSGCGAGDELRREITGLRGASAAQIVDLGPGPDDADSATVMLVSMPSSHTERYLRLQRGLHRDCPTAVVDTEAAPVEEHHEMQEVRGLGDEAVLEASWWTGGPEYDRKRSYRVESRVGGVLVVASAEGGVAEDGHEHSLSLAVRAARRVHSELYRADG